MCVCVWVDISIFSINCYDRAVEDFKSYLEDSYGAGSQEIVSFEVWLAILLHQKVPKGCKNFHARKIYR